MGKCCAAFGQFSAGIWSSRAQKLEKEGHRYVFRRKAEDIATEASETINWLRQETWDRLSDFYGRIARGKHRVREYAETICDFMEREQIYLQIQKRIERFREEGNFEAVKEYEQIYDVS